MIEDVNKAIKTGRLRQLTYEEAKRYQFIGRGTKIGNAVLYLIKKGEISAYWDNKENSLIYAGRGD